MASIRRVLDLSTEHLPREMRDELIGYDRDGGAPSWGGTSGVYPTEYGALVWVPDNPAESSATADEPVPPVLLTIQTHARKHDCDYILFDADGPTDDDLDVFPYADDEEEVSQ